MSRFSTMPGMVGGGLIAAGLIQSNMQHGMMCVAIAGTKSNQASNAQVVRQGKPRAVWRLVLLM